MSRIEFVRKAEVCNFNVHFTVQQKVLCLHEKKKKVWLIDRRTTQ